MIKIIRRFIHFITLSSLLVLSLLLMSWGYTGHKKINEKAALFFNQPMAQFLVWTSTLANHASDADYRKETDPSESPKHYIDLDLYPEFVENGRIPQTLDSAVALHGQYFVYDAGILPWATLTTYDSLKACFLRKDWNKAVLFAADLGHYVADGHMPLHLCKNYDGQYTGNDGIHSRYESGMINTYINQVVYEGDNIELVTDVNQYVFDYLYSNFTYSDSVIEADNYGRSVNPNVYSSQYRQALWEKTKDFTTMMFRNSSRVLAELMYSAWVEAGSPVIEYAAIHENDDQGREFLKQNFPNPVMTFTTFEYNLPEPAVISLEIKDITGRTILVVDTGYKSAGNHTIRWNADELPASIYFAIFRFDNQAEMVKMVKY